MPLKRLMLLAIAVLFFAPLAASMAMHPPADVPWYAASRAPTGLAPDPTLVREPVVQVYAARAFGWRGGFAVHTWIIVKRADADAFTRYDVVGWSGPPHVRVNYAAPDAEWYSSRPELLIDRRGEGVEALIDAVEAAIERYPFAGTYRTWPGPNSNTFVAHIGRSVPALGLDLPASAIGKDYAPLSAAIGRAPSGTGIQVSMLGALGLIVAPEEGLEINVLGLSLGVDLAHPALRLPGVGRLGAAEPPR
ncbi:MAG: DUF3750 domain-containing protein [Burkholderiales bacterium]|nr:DUF3750 domain-containing protein [Burkholderiales bacterium]